MIALGVVRSEKFLCALAAGLWYDNIFSAIFPRFFSSVFSDVFFSRILKPSYLEACSMATHFVDEVDHEWGPEDCTSPDNKSKEKEESREEG